MFYTYSSFSVQHLLNYKSSVQIIHKSFFYRTMYMVSIKMFFFFMFKSSIHFIKNKLKVMKH